MRFNLVGEARSRYSVFQQFVAVRVCSRRLEHPIRTHGDAAFAAAAFLGVLDDHMLVKPEVHFPQYAVFAFVDTHPAGFAFAGVRADIVCAVSSQPLYVCVHGAFSPPVKSSFRLLFHDKGLL